MFYRALILLKIIFMKHVADFDWRKLGFIISVNNEAGAGLGIRFCVVPNVGLLRNSASCLGASVLDTASI